MCVIASGLSSEALAKEEAKQSNSPHVKWPVRLLRRINILLAMTIKIVQAFSSQRGKAIL